MSELFIPAESAFVTLRWRLDGDPEEMMSTFGGRIDPVIEVPVASNLAVGIYQAWTSNFPADKLITGWTFTGVNVLKGPRSSSEYGQHDENNVGSRSSTSLTNNTAMLFRKITALSGRRNRGRMYLPPGYLAESDVDQRGFIGTGTVTDLQLRMAGFVESILSGGVHACFEWLELFHTDNGEDPDDLTPTPITGIFLQPQVATMRHRMRR